VVQGTRCRWPTSRAPTGSPSGCAGTPPPCTARRRRTASWTRSPPAGFPGRHTPIYTRYLGDLSGGQYLGRAIVSAYQLGADGHGFFRFPDVDPGAFKTYYRGLLDTQTWSLSEQDEFLAEVAEAYRLNISVLDDPHRRWG
jgi:hypothetical protein